jgi:hypothetical protein
MGKRYGRNQKRAIKEQVRQLDRKISSLKGVVAELDMLAGEFRNAFINYIPKMLENIPSNNLY